MKYISLLSLLFVSYKYVNAYSDCNGCSVVTVEDGVEWGVENNDWCIGKLTNNYNNKNNKNIMYMKNIYMYIMTH